MKANPKYYWLQVVTADQITNRRLFVTPQNIQQRAEHAARQDGVEVVFVIDGGTAESNLDCPPLKAIIQRIEPSPDHMQGLVITVTHPPRVLHEKSPGASIADQTPIAQLKPVYTELGKYGQNGMSTKKKKSKKRKRKAK